MEVAEFTSIRNDPSSQSLLGRGVERGGMTAKVPLSEYHPNSSPSSYMGCGDGEEAGLSCSAAALSCPVCYGVARGAASGQAWSWRGDGTLLFLLNPGKGGSSSQFRGGVRCPEGRERGSERGPAGSRPAVLSLTPPAPWGGKESGCCPAWGVRGVGWEGGGAQAP